MKLKEFKQLLSEIVREAVREEVRSELKELKKSLNNNKINENFNFISNNAQNFGLKQNLKNQLPPSPIIQNNINSDKTEQNVLFSVIAETINEMDPGELRNFGTGNTN